MFIPRLLASAPAAAAVASARLAARGGRDACGAAAGLRVSARELQPRAPLLQRRRASRPRHPPRAHRSAITYTLTEYITIFKYCTKCTYSILVQIHN